MLRPALNNIVKYELYHDSIGLHPIIEVKGWEDVDEEYSRDKKGHGAIKKYTSNNTFIGSAVDFIDYVYDTYGINSKIKSIRSQRHPKTNEWVETFNQTLKSTSYTKENNGIKIGSFTSELEDKMKNFKNEKFELDRLTSVDGKPITPLNTRLLELRGQNIFLKTTFKIDEQDNETRLYNSEKNDNLRGSRIAGPIKIDGKSHEQAHDVVQDIFIGDNSVGGEGVGEASGLFFANNDRLRYLKIKFSLSVKIDVEQYEDVSNFVYRILLTTYKDGEDYNFKEHRTLFTSTSKNAIDGERITINFDEEIPLEQGESLCLQFNQKARLGGFIDVGRLEILHSEMSCDMTIEEDSNFDASQTKVVLLHEVGDRICEIVTGEKGLFESYALGCKESGYQQDGYWAYLAFGYGFWIRKFYDQKMKISFKEFKSFLFAILGMDISFGVVNGKEKMIAEPFGYYYQNFIGVKLPLEISGAKEKYDSSRFYSVIEVGSKKGGTYESIIGLTEYNTKTNWTTPITVTENKYIAQSEIRRDGLEVEIIRRKPKYLYPDEDTRSDEDVFALDCKEGVTNVLQLRKWEDDFDEAPKNIFSPETSINFRLSDTRSMLRHGSLIRAGLNKNLSDSILFNTSIGNSEMITKLNGKELAENGNILSSDLDKDFFTLKEIEFNHKVNFEILQQINGTTVIDGREIPNLYGLIEYKENGIVKYGRFSSIKPRGKGSFTLLKTENG